jgi:hypothetical protein
MRQSDFDDWYGDLGSGLRPKRQESSCFEKHPKLVLGDSGFAVWGGSCVRPKVPDADVYIGFDIGMRFTSRQWPWTPGHEVLFEIRDMGVPNPHEFWALIEWTVTQLKAGKKVHAGCIGGHGRTGLFLSALVLAVLKDKDAISHVRKHYCPRAVESKAQIDFLVKHFGIKRVEPGKTSKSVKGLLEPAGWSGSRTGGKKKSGGGKKRTAGSLTSFAPIGKGSIWGG